MNNELCIKQRDFKITMTVENIKYLFDMDKDITNYLYKKTQTFSTGFFECVHLNILKLLDDKKNTNLEMIYNLLNENLSLQNKTIDNNCFNMILNNIINDYNTYYLDDKYYYNGYWYDGGWEKNDEDDDNEDDNEDDMNEDDMNEDEMEEEENIIN